MVVWSARLREQNVFLDVHKLFRGYSHSPSMAALKLTPAGEWRLLKA
jgi:hypothetical protein